MKTILLQLLAVGALCAVETPAIVPSPKPGGIFMFGDSTTAPRGGVKTYAEQVGVMLQSSGSSVAVHNAGRSGNTTAAAIKRLQTEVLAHQPRVVVIQFGINDSAVDVWKKPPVTTPRVPLENFVANLRAMITESQKAGARVILMTTNPLRWTGPLRKLYGTPPYDPAVEDGLEKPFLLAYNDAVRALSKEFDLPLVDVHSAYPGFAAKKNTTPDALLPDGMHPGDLGHQLVAELLLPVILRLLN